MNRYEGGQIKGTKNLWGGGGGTLASRNQISVKSVFVYSIHTFHKNICFTICLNTAEFLCSTHTFHKNVCFTVCLNSAEFCDSAMVNIGC